jgi:hypothetical protein
MGVWNLDELISHTEMPTTDIMNLTRKLVTGRGSIWRHCEA